MAFGQNTMMGSGYNPMGMLYNQPSYMQPSYMQQNPNEIQGVRFVNGIEGAKACMLPFGSRALLMDQNSQHFYIKEVDGNGIVNLKEYAFEEVTPPTENNGDYVTREELMQFINANYVPKQEYDQLKEQYESSVFTSEPTKSDDGKSDSTKW